MVKFLFFVQGEGRGHLTQAIALAEILRSAGHEVSAVMVGLTEGREIPDFFLEKIQAEIIPFESPSLAYGVKTKALNIRKTLTNSLLGIRGFMKSIRQINQVVERIQPDMIINFYDVLAGIYNFLYRPPVPMVCVAHQYLLLHKDFVFPEKRLIYKFFVNLNTKITALGATKKLALSFDKFSNDDAQNIVVVPPLLRSEVKHLQPKIAEKPFILAYTTVPSMADDLIKWHQNNQKTVVHCFWDKPQNKPEFKHSPNLTFHKINAPKFLEMMQNCSGLATSAGFESVCEAMSLGKPVMMIPVPKHFEQACNALDGERAGAGIQGESFDLSKFLNFLPSYKDVSPKFNAWQNQVSQAFLVELEAILLQNKTFQESVLADEQFRFDFVNA